MNAVSHKDEEDEAGTATLDEVISVGVGRCHHDTDRLVPIA